jgi:hypothetical protein
LLSLNSEIIILSFLGDNFSFSSLTFRIISSSMIVPYESSVTLIELCPRIFERTPMFISLHTCSQVLQKENSHHADHGHSPFSALRNFVTVFLVSPFRFAESSLRSDLPFFLSQTRGCSLRSPSLSFSPANRKQPPCYAWFCVSLFFLDFIFLLMKMIIFLPFGWYTFEYPSRYTSKYH